MTSYVRKGKQQLSSQNQLQIEKQGQPSQRVTSFPQTQLLKQSFQGFSEGAAGLSSNPRNRQSNRQSKSKYAKEQMQRAIQRKSNMNGQRRQLKNETEQMLQSALTSRLEAINDSLDDLHGSVDGIWDAIDTIAGNKKNNINRLHPRSARDSRATVQINQNLHRTLQEESSSKSNGTSASNLEATNRTRQEQVARQEQERLAAEAKLQQERLAEEARLARLAEEARLARQAAIERKAQKNGLISQLTNFKNTTLEPLTKKGKQVARQEAVESMKLLNKELQKIKNHNTEASTNNISMVYNKSSINGILKEYSNDL